MLTLTLVTVLYLVAALALVGMVPYTDISAESGFPDGFAYRGVEWAAQFTAVSISIESQVAVFSGSLFDLYNQLSESLIMTIYY